jgi:hypothetical protein
MDSNEMSFVIREKSQTQIVIQSTPMGVTRFQSRLSITVKEAPSLPVLASDHQKGCLGFLHSPAWEGRPEPLRDPTLGGQA